MQNRNLTIEQTSIHREEDLFIQAAQLEGMDRELFLERVCADSASLKTRMKALLSIDGRKDELLDQIYLNCDQSETRIEPGDTIGPYQLLECIGEGGMGKVFLANQKKPFERNVALKIIRAGDSTDELTNRFDLERKSLSLFDHPNLTKIFDAGLTKDGAPFFVMELVPGKSITRFCDENHLTIASRLGLFADVCSGIHHAHQKGVIHRDIKPSNVLVMMQDDEAVAKIIDFGIAKALGKDTQLATAQTTQLGNLVGTLEYMSPEQIKCDSGGIDARSDIYSLGVLLYELVTGEVPLNQKSDHPGHLLDTLEAIRDVAPKKPSQCLASAKQKIGQVTAANRGTQTKNLVKSLSGDLDRIVLKALHKDPNQRFESAAAFRNDILAFLNGDPVSAVSPTVTYRMRKYFLKHQALCLLGLLLFIAMLVGTAFSISQSIRATRAERKSATLVTQLQEKNRKLQKALQSARLGLELRSITNRNKNIVKAIRQATVKLFNSQFQFANLSGGPNGFDTPGNFAYGTSPSVPFFDELSIGIGIGHPPTSWFLNAGDVQPEIENFNPFNSEESPTLPFTPDEFLSQMPIQLVVPGLSALQPSDDPNRYRIPKLDGRDLRLKNEYSPPEMCDYIFNEMSKFLKFLQKEQQLIFPKNDPFFAETASMMGQVNFYSNDIESARLQFEESLRIDQSHKFQKRQAFTQLWLARCYHRMDQSAQAQTMLTDAQLNFDSSQQDNPHAEIDKLLEDFLKSVSDELRQLP